MEETTVACWERPEGFARYAVGVWLAGFACLGTAPTAFQHPMRCIVSGFFVRCKNFFRLAAARHSTLHFCRTLRGACLESRTQQ